MKSIRRNLLIFLLSGVAAAALICGGLLYEKTKQSLVSHFDSGLAAKGGALGMLLEVEGEYLEFNYDATVMPEYAGGADPEYLQLWFEDGEALDKSITMGESEFPFRFGSVEEPDFWDLELPDGRPGRAIGVLIPVIVDADDDDGEPLVVDDDSYYVVNVVLVVARARAELDATLGALRDAAWLAGVVLTVLVMIVVLVGVRVGLRPIAAMEKEVASIGAASLSRRVSRDSLPVELQAMAGKLNELLARLQEAFGRERRMTGNIAHELRTPIAELRAATEVALRWPDDLDMARTAIETAHAVSVRMGDLIVGLLRLARVAIGEAELERKNVSLQDLIARLWTTYEPTARERGLRFDQSLPRDVVLKTDPILFSNILGNLMDNAVHHAAPNATITCVAEAAADGSVLLSLENPPGTLVAADLDRLTEPFWQKDAARSDSNHSGLGLTLVSSIVEALGMELDFHLGPTFRVTIRIAATAARWSTARHPSPAR